jgi:hypothetical protein
LPLFRQTNVAVGVGVGGWLALSVGEGLGDEVGDSSLVVGVGESSARTVRRWSPTDKIRGTPTAKPAMPTARTPASTIRRRWIPLCRLSMRTTYGRTLARRRLSLVPIAHLPN